MRRPRSRGPIGPGARLSRSVDSKVSLKVEKCAPAGIGRCAAWARLHGTAAGPRGVLVLGGPFISSLLYFFKLKRRRRPLELDSRLAGFSSQFLSTRARFLERGRDSYQGAFAPEPVLPGMLLCAWPLWSRSLGTQPGGHRG